MSKKYYQEEEENNDVAVNNVVVKDSNGNVLKDGDSVQLIKDLTLRGSSTKFKIGTVFKNIRLIPGNDEEIECKGIVLRTEFIKLKK